MARPSYCCAVTRWWNTWAWSLVPPSNLPSTLTNWSRVVPELLAWPRIYPESSTLSRKQEYMYHVALRNHTSMWVWTVPTPHCQENPHPKSSPGPTCLFSSRSHLLTASRLPVSVQSFGSHVLCSTTSPTLLHYGRKTNKQTAPHSFIQSLCRLVWEHSALMDFLDTPVFSRTSGPSAKDQSYMRLEGKGGRAKIGPFLTAFMCFFYFKYSFLKLFSIFYIPLTIRACT